MLSDTLVYLSGPITAKDGFSVEENVAAALKVYLACIKVGIPAICVHLGAAFPSAFDVPYETWMCYDFALLDHATHVCMLPRWRSSAGAVREREYAEARGLRVFEDYAAMLAAFSEQLRKAG